MLVADIGDGTPDFSVVRVGPRRATVLDHKADILANHGVAVAGTDFDRRIELAGILPEPPRRRRDRRGLPVPMGS